MKPERDLRVMVEKVVIHKCNQCPKAFYRLIDLVKHISFHEDRQLSHITSAYVPLVRAKIFKCESCTDSFESKRDFMLHKLQHIQKNVRDERKVNRSQINDEIDKPYKCPDCECTYVAESSLNEHSILHLPFPHACECGIGYYKLQDLKLHMKLVHGTEWVKPRKKEEEMEEANAPSSTDDEVPVLPILNTNSSKKPTSKAVLKTKNRSAKKSKSRTVKLKNENDRKPKRRWNIPNPDIEVIKTPDNRYECPECKKTFAYKTNVFTHYRVHTGERPYPCDLCGKGFTQWGALKKHIRGHTNTEKSFVCQFCPKAFTCVENRARHEQIHSATKRHECPFCNKGFHDPSALTRHKRIHTGDKRYRCPHCPKAFTDISGLNGHKLRHENNKNFECEICKKKFYTRHDLGKHTVTHNNERNFCCDHCNKYFSSKGYLSIHMKLHINPEKRFECEICYRKFFLKYNLKKHVVTMHKNKAFYVCKECNKWFYDKSKFKKHQLSHADLKENSGIHCQKCSQNFACKKHFEEHSLQKS